MGIDLTYNAWERHPVELIGGSPPASDFFLTANYGLGPTNEYECDTQALCLEQLHSYMLKIKDMGFNSFRFHTMGVKQNFKNKYVELQEKLYLVINPNEPRDSAGNLIWFPGDTVFRFLPLERPYNTNPYVTKLHDSYEIILNMADTVGLKVMIDVSTYGVTHNDIAVSNYTEYLGVLGDRLKNHRNLLGYIIVEEPLYTDTIEQSKKVICEKMNSFYDTLKAHDPNHLITIGGHDIFDVSEWDLTALKMDFYQPHIYTKDSRKIDPDINHQINRVLSRFYWLDKNCPMPWMIGEMGIGCNDTLAPPYVLCSNCDEQKMFADTTLKMLMNFGGSGYSWWYFQEIIDDDKEEVGYGLLKHGDVASDTIEEKPAVEIFRNFLDSNRLTPLYSADTSLKFKPENYYDPFYYSQYNDSIPTYIHGKVIDQYGNKIEDAFIDAFTKVEWTDSIFHFTIYNHYSLTNEDGNYTIIPIDEDSIFNQRFKYVFELRYSATGAEYKKIGGWSGGAIIDSSTITLKRTNFKYDDLVQNLTITESTYKLLSGWNTLTAENVTVENGVSGDITARQEVHLTGETHIEAGSEVHIYNAETFKDCDCYVNFTRMSNEFVTDSRINAGIKQLKIDKNMELDFKLPHEEFSVSVYPNPSEGIFTVDIANSDESKSDYSFKIVNSFGKLVQNYTSNNEQNSIDLSNESPGIYYLKITANNQSRNFKLIKF